MHMRPALARLNLLTRATTVVITIMKRNSSALTLEAIMPQAHEKR